LYKSEAKIIGIGGGGSGHTRYFFNGFIINNSANEKLGIFHSVWGSTAGAGAAPNRQKILSSGLTHQTNVIF
jgi:hypothetical protein